MEAFASGNPRHRLELSTKYLAFSNEHTYANDVGAYLNMPLVAQAGFEDGARK